MNKVASVESARMMAVIDETIEKIRTLQLLERPHSSSSGPEMHLQDCDTPRSASATPRGKQRIDSMKHAGSLLYNEEPTMSTSLSNNTRNNNDTHKVDDILAKQSDLEKEYERILQAYGNSWGHNAPTEVEELSRKLQIETRETCRQLTGFVSDQDQHKFQHGIDVTSPSSMLLDYVIKMKDVATDKLMTSVEQESMRAEYINEMVTRTEEAQAKQSELEVALAKERDDKETNISFFSGIIIKLKAELQDISASSTKAFSLLQDETERVQTANKLAWDDDKVKRSVATETTRETLVGAVDGNSTHEEAMRKKKGKMSIEVGSWIDKYDKDIGHLYDEIEKTRALYDIEKVERDKLEHKFSVDDLDLANEKDEEALIQDKIDEERKNESVLMKCAQLVQKLYRGRLARKEVSKKKKGKKKKGKKGKKGKKKK